MSNVVARGLYSFVSSRAAVWGERTVLVLFQLFPLSFGALFLVSYQPHLRESELDLILPSWISVYEMQCVISILILFASLRVVTRFFRKCFQEAKGISPEEEFDLIWGPVRWALLVSLFFSGVVFLWLPTVGIVFLSYLTLIIPVLYALKLLSPMFGRIFEPERLGRFFRAIDRLNDRIDRVTGPVRKRIKSRATSFFRDA